MSNKGFNLPTGLKAGPLTIDAATGTISTSGNVRITGAGTFVGTNAPGGAPILTPSTDVKLLLNMNGTNGSTSFTDSSTFARTVTPVGSAQISTAVKKYGTASLYLNGANNYLSIPASSDFAFGTEDFTIECWVYPTFNLNTTSISPRLFILAGLIQASWDNYYKSWHFSNSYNGYVARPTGGIYASQWTHIAYTRSGTTSRVFFNGELAATGTDSQNYTATNNASRIGETNDGVQGYIDDFRVIKGQAVYTANFTPPAAELTTTVGTPAPASNVKLLLNMNGTNGSTSFTDSSGYARTVTPVGNAQLSTSVKKYGTASAYLDGSGDYLTVASNSDFAFGTGDFTVECWVYQTARSSGAGMIIDTLALGGIGNRFNAITLYVHPAGTVRVFSNGIDRLTTSSTVSLNTWTHLALVRSSGVTTVYIDGVASGTTSYSMNLTDTACNIGVTANVPTTAGYTFVGYIDDLRIVKGQAVYTANFTPPTAELTTTVGTPAPAPAPSNVKLLLNMNGSDGSTSFTDSSDYAKSVTAYGNAQLSTSVKKYGTASAYLDGAAGDYLTVASNSDFAFGTGDFTVEAWVRFSAFAADFRIIRADSYNGFFFGIHRNGTALGFGREGLAWDYDTPHGMSTNTWYHIAITSASGSIKLFVNGAQIGSTYTNPGYSYDMSLNRVQIGAGAVTYIDDLRVIKGQAVYTANFTPPAAELTTTI